MFLSKICGNLVSKLAPLISTNVVSPMAIHTSSVLAAKVARYRSGNEMRKTVGKKSDGIVLGDGVDIDVKNERFQRYPTSNLPNQLFSNIAFKDLPIINIKVSKNNTIINCSDSKGRVMIISSCGINGFKKCRKGTNVAGQATAIVVAKKCLEKGVHTVRVVVHGLGPGRSSSLKGLQMGGLTMVSLTDATRVSDNPPRARKARRV